MLSEPFLRYRQAGNAQLVLLFLQLLSNRVKANQKNEALFSDNKGLKEKISEYEQKEKEAMQEELNKTEDELKQQVKIIPTEEQVEESLDVKYYINYGKNKGNFVKSDMFETTDKETGKQIPAEFSKDELGKRKKAREFWKRFGFFR